MFQIPTSRLSVLSQVLIVRNFGAFQGHLAIIDTPSGTKTTIAILETFGGVNLGASGAWVLSDGTTVSSGTANDLVVAGVVRFAPYAFLGGPAVDLVPRFPTPPFPYDPTPLATHTIPQGGVGMGSFYGAAHSPFPATPIRSFTTFDTGLFEFGRWAHLLVIHAGADTYFVVACGEAKTALQTPTRCTVSGTGGFARFTGSAFYQIVGISIKLALQVYVTS